MFDDVFVEGHGGCTAMALGAMHALSLAGLLAPRRTTTCFSMASVMAVAMALGRSPEWLLRVARDSKMLKESERELLYDRVADWCEAWAVGHASPEECDELGMSEAQRLAAQRALAELDHKPTKVLLDGKWDFVGEGTSEMLVKGDARCLSIAAASILAKVTRDRIMRDAAEHHPLWNFEANKGYPCPRHKEALRGVGPSAIHRVSWVFMDNLPWTGLPRFVPPPPIDPTLRYQQALF